MGHPVITIGVQRTTIAVDPYRPSGIALKAARPAPTAFPHFAAIRRAFASSRVQGGGKRRAVIPKPKAARIAAGKKLANNHATPGEPGRVQRTAA